MFRTGRFRYALFRFFLSKEKRRRKKMRKDVLLLWEHDRENRIKNRLLSGNASYSRSCGVARVVTTRIDYYTVAVIAIIE